MYPDLIYKSTKWQAFPILFPKYPYNEILYGITIVIYYELKINHGQE